MRSRRRLWLTFLLGGGMFLCIIFGSDTAMTGATEGIGVCLHTIVPVLLPYIFLSSLLAGTITGRRIPLLRPFGWLCSIPAGAESLFLLGLISGYPVGAKLIGEAYGKGELSHSAANRMMAFCSNAGPSFILGMLPHLFTKGIVPWLLWFIHIVSAILIGMLIPSKDPPIAVEMKLSNSDLSKVMSQTVKSLSLICGWVILFRILIAFICEYFRVYLSPVIRVILIGLMELANGCISLNQIPYESVRFVICSCILAFGGLCVMMQTSSVCYGLGLRMYIVGKILQTLISLAIALPCSYLLYSIKPDIWFFLCFAVLVAIITLAIVTFQNGKKKIVAIP